MYAQLGNIVFKGLKGFQGLQSTRETNFAQHAVIEGKPKLQRIGTNLEELTIGIQFHASFCTPETEISALDSARQDAEVLPFVNGAGEFLGTFVIKSIRKTMEELGTDGSIKMCTVDLDLMEFATSDAQSSAGLAAMAAGIAMAGNLPMQVNQIARVQSEAAGISAPLTTAKALSTTTSSYITKAKQVASQAQHYKDKAQATLRTMRDALETSNRMLTNAKRTYQTAAQIKKAIADTQNSISSTIFALQGGTIDDALFANRELQRAVSSMNTATTEVVNITATRR